MCTAVRTADVRTLCTSIQDVYDPCPAVSKMLSKITTKSRELWNRMYWVQRVSQRTLPSASPGSSLDVVPAPTQLLM